MLLHKHTAVQRLAVMAGLVAFSVGHGTLLHGQILHASGARPSFAVASIRLHPPGRQEFFRTTVQADSFTARVTTVKQLISFAYGITFSGEISGGPKWIGTDEFDIEARPEDAAALSKLSRDDLDERMRLMVQSLLAERFGLKVIFQKKVLPVYLLEVAKGGLKCPKVTLAPDMPLAKMGQPRFAWTALPPPPPPPPGWVPPPADEARTLQQTMHMRTNYWPFWLVVTAISHEPELAGRTVIDKTGLSGGYDCEVSWSRAGSEGQGPSFFTAIQEQMGLKLEPAKGEVETLAIESVERPSEN